MQPLPVSTPLEFLKKLPIISCLVVTMMSAGWAFAAGSPLALELAVNENRVDGCTDCGCNLKGRLDAGKKLHWWISFGLAAAGTEGDSTWIAVDASSRCGVGPFSAVEDGFLKTIGSPYIIVESSTQAKRDGKNGLVLETQTSYRKLSGFGRDGKAGYDQRTSHENTRIDEQAGIVIPVLFSNAAEQDAFRVYEVLVKLDAYVLGSKPAASYGSISVTADVPGAAVLLDGGFVGRITEDSPLLVSNVLAGNRELQVKDFSERSASEVVAVNAGQTTEAALSIMKLDEAGLAGELAPLGKNPQGFAEYWRTKDGAIVIAVPAGSFLMGSPEGKGDPDEHPQHTVDVNRYLIDKNEVTWRQFVHYSNATGNRLPTEPYWGIIPNYPVSYVLWDEARAYCAWAGGQLPTEAEWEKAARGTDGRTYPWGDEWDASRCNSLSGSLHRPESAGSFPMCISPYGALDMSGSMWEWTLDPYQPYSASGLTENSDQAESENTIYTMRGGAWVSQGDWLRAAFRLERSPSSRNMDHGFRCAMKAEDPDR